MLSVAWSFRWKVGSNFPIILGAGLGGPLCFIAALSIESKLDEKYGK